LISKQMLGSTTRELVAEILSWGGLTISLPFDIDAALDHGLVSPGQAYAVQKPFAVAFLIEFLLRWKALTEVEKEQALGDPWTFKAHVFEAPAPSALGVNVKEVVHDHAASRKRSHGERRPRLAWGRRWL
jgi:hypothetical protein